MLANDVSSRSETRNWRLLVRGSWPSFPEYVADALFPGLFTIVKMVLERLN
ncbi:hypothetical protein EMCG_07628 [[Emmonsia] crescens]|uniref:Uncharacterized protein n=1 Tax=[Emmonsia] crescens TaxID=73230 RepID=A0A0G2J5F5_9EURO|nr:hypothetical protein EMCG_07628 [Emmonsia crescens UAMH 3008]